MCAQSLGNSIEKHSQIIEMNLFHFKQFRVIRHEKVHTPLCEVERLDILNKIQKTGYVIFCDFYRFFTFFLKYFNRKFVGKYQ